MKNFLEFVVFMLVIAGGAAIGNILFGGVGAAIGGSLAMFVCIAVFAKMTTGRY